MTPQTSSESRSSGCIIWLTGLSGAGKTTLATGLTQFLNRHHRPACLLDGDEIRRGLSADLGFSPEDRAENVRRAAEVAGLLARSGLVAIVALISPMESERRKARALAASTGAGFFEVFVDCPLAVCEQRDPKGLYKRARGGSVAAFTGIDAIYERPANPEITLRTGEESPEESLARLVDLIRVPGGL